MQQQTPKLSPETKVAKLVEMGFNAQWAAKALERTNGDVSEAAQLLLSKGPAAKSPPVLSSNKAAPAAAVANGSRSSTPGSSSSSSSLPRTVSPAPIVKATATSKPKLNAPPLDPQVESKSNELRLKGNDLFKAGDYAAAKGISATSSFILTKKQKTTTKKNYCGECSPLYRCSRSYPKGTSCYSAPARQPCSVQPQCRFIQALYRRLQCRACPRSGRCQVADASCKMSPFILVSLTS